MNVLPAISSVGLFGLGNLNPVARTFSASTASSLSFAASSSTFVQLSGLGQLMSAVANFQGRLAVLQPGSSDSGLGTNFGTDFGSLAVAAQAFVDSFNTLQGSLNSLSALSGTLTAASPVTQLTRDLNERIVSEFDNDESTLTRLSDLGLEFQPSSLPGFVGSLSIDLAAMKEAFDTDPEGSFSLLASAVDTFEQLATEATGPANSTSSLLATQLQFSASLLSLSLTGADRRNTTLQGFSDLFALASLGDARGDTQARLFLALNEFSLVSSLIG